MDIAMKISKPIVPESLKSGARIILADPPWSTNQKGKRGAVEKYPLMTTEQIKAMPVNDLAAEDNMENYFHIEMELVGVTPQELAFPLMEHFEGQSCPLLGKEDQYMVSDRLQRDWFLLQNGKRVLLLSPALDPASDLLPMVMLLGIIKKVGAFMDDSCDLRIRAQGLTQKAVDEMCLALKDGLRR